MSFKIGNFQEKNIFISNKKRDFFHNLEIDNIENKTIILDIDGTLLPYGEDKIENDLIFDKVKMLDKNNSLYLCSNSFSSGRPEGIAKYLGVKNLKTSLFVKKPIPGIINKIEQKYRTKEKIIIGDLFLSEGILAKFLSSKFIWTSPYKSIKDPKWAIKIDTVDQYIFNFFKNRSLKK